MTWTAPISSKLSRMFCYRLNMNKTKMEKNMCQSSTRRWKIAIWTSWIKKPRDKTFFPLVLFFIIFFLSVSITTIHRCASQMICLPILTTCVSNVCSLSLNWDTSLFGTFCHWRICLTWADLSPSFLFFYILSVDVVFPTMICLQHPLGRCSSHR